MDLWYQFGYTAGTLFSSSVTIFNNRIRTTHHWAGMMTSIPFRHELRALFEQGLQTPVSAAALIQTLYPTGARLKSVFLDEHADVCDALDDAYSKMRPSDPLDIRGWLKVLSLDLNRSDVTVYGASGDEIAVGDPLTYANQFPKAAQAIAKTYLKPDVYFFEVVCKEPTASSGTRFHLLFRDAVHF